LSVNPYGEASLTQIPGAQLSAKSIKKEEAWNSGSGSAPLVSSRGLLFGLVSGVFSNTFLTISNGRSFLAGKSSLV